ncbi:hypothetical protein [Phaeobacter sp. J2-8]|uniref:hypothetical protein n=1 Tax=Phaeobacter sp. J2-8 TaxID=2931394 RepID=UPI001FD523F1|nr:hypothetical protein [Phaeobacter sp. J2-8]MCJ7871490.1 hypothetical protein [Phaeobacter sp. J2-8]
MAGHALVMKRSGGAMFGLTWSAVIDAPRDGKGFDLVQSNALAVLGGTHKAVHTESIEPRFFESNAPLAVALQRLVLVICQLDLAPFDCLAGMAFCAHQAKDPRAC